MRISRSDKIDPPGYCVAISHDQEDFDFVNHAYKTDIMKVNLNFEKMHMQETFLATQRSWRKSAPTCRSLKRGM